MLKRKPISKSLKARKVGVSKLQSMLRKENAKLHNRIAFLEAKVISQDNRIKALEKQLSHGTVPQIDMGLSEKASELLNRIRS